MTSWFEAPVIMYGTRFSMAITSLARVPELPYPPMRRSTLSDSTARVTGVTALPGASSIVSAITKVMLTLVFHVAT